MTKIESHHGGFFFCLFFTILVQKTFWISNYSKFIFLNIFLVVYTLLQGTKWIDNVNKICCNQKPKTDTQFKVVHLKNFHVKHLKENLSLLDETL